MAVTAHTLHIAMQACCT